MKIFCGLSLLILAAVSVEAQTPAPVPAPRAFIELSNSSESVKGAPFSAEAVNESVQTLADGNRIVRKWTSKLYRNSQGQFRREGSGMPGAAFGAYVTGGASAVTIMDPVGGNRFFYDTDSKTARVFTLPNATVRVNGRAPIVVEGNADTEKIQTELNAAGAAGVRVLRGGSLPGGGVTTAWVGPSNSKYETKTESLGIQNFDGVDAEGTRTVTTIPADAIGNERPIEIVYERWYSKELQMIVNSKHSDPRFGEQTYRLTNIIRSEPDPSLFEVPDGYKVLTPTTRQSRTIRLSPLPTRTNAVRAIPAKNATSTGSRP